MGETFTLAFSTAELFYLVSELRVTPLPLLGEPLSEGTSEFSADRLNESQVALAGRGYAQRKRDGSLGLDMTVAAMVAATGAPEVSLVAARLGDGQTQHVLHVYCASGLLVEYEKGPGDNHSLTALQDLDVLGARLLEFLEVEADAAFEPDAAIYLMPESAIREAICIAGVEGRERGAAFLQDKGMSPSSARQLAETLVHPSSQGTLLALAWKEGRAEALGTIAVLEGKGGLWVLSGQAAMEEPTVEVAAVDGATVSQRIDDFLKVVFGPTRPLSPEGQ